MKREVRRIHWYTAEKEKTNDTNVIKDQTYCIFYNLSDLSTNNTIIKIIQIHSFVKRPSGGSSKISLRGGGGGEGAGQASKHTEPSLLANSVLIQH